MEFGATHTFASMEEALPAMDDLTWGQMADKVIMTVGVVRGDMMARRQASCAPRAARSWSPRSPT